MVARPGTYQASNNAGELAPAEYGRTDIKQYFAGMAIMRNVEPVPQGGSQLSMRTRHLGRVRKLLAQVDLTGGASTLPGGAYAAPAVLATLSFAASNVSVVNLPNWSASQPLDAILQVEALSGGVYVAFGAPFGIGIETAGITVALPPGQSIATTNIRVRMVSAPPSATTFTGAGILLWRETATLALARIRPFTFDLQQTYVAVLTNGLVDFYRDGVWVGAAVTSFGENQIAAGVDTPQRLDTMLLFHPDLPSARILRDGADNQWTTSQLPFENVPLVDLGGAYTNQTADVWGLYLHFPTAASAFINGRSLLLSIDVNGEDAVVPMPGTDPDWNAIAVLIKSAIEATSTVDPGITVDVLSSASGTQNFLITFTGARNLGKINVLSARIVNTAEAAATVSHNAIGDPGGEALISAGRGYAGTAAFYQDRLVTGGFRSKKSAFLASVTGEYFDLNVKITSASGAILANIDTDGAEQLQHIVRDKYLLLFTSDGEYFIADRALDRTKPPTIVNSSRYGSAADLPVIANEGEILWASRNKSVLYAAAYDEVATSYVAQPISLLAPHIVNAMADMALQRPTGVGNAARLWMPRADGTVTVGIILRGQDVTAFVRWETPGSVMSNCVDGKNVPHMLVQRVVAGVPELHLERLETGLIFDDVVERDFGSPQSVINGLSVHEGAEVWADADGYVVGPFTVTDGAIVLADQAAANVKVGRWTPPLARTLPLPAEVSDRVVLRRPKRVHTVRIDLADTTSLAIGANGRRARNVALARAGGPIDAPQEPVTRREVVTGLKGVSDDGQVDITQTRPGQLAWRGITIEARG